MFNSESAVKCPHCSGAGFKFKVGEGQYVALSVQVKEMFLQWKHLFTIGMKC